MNGRDYSDIRVMRTIHDRNGVDTVLYHICLLMNDGRM